MASSELCIRNAQWIGISRQGLLTSPSMNERSGSAQLDAGMKWQALSHKCARGYLDPFVVLGI
jgi:hypothetical protein